MSTPSAADQWDTATWQGARRAQIREYLKLTVRERLEAVAAMSEVAEHLQAAASEASQVPHPSRSEKGSAPFVE